MKVKKLKWGTSEVYKIILGLLLPPACYISVIFLIDYAFPKGWTSLILICAWSLLYIFMIWVLVDTLKVTKDES